MIAELDVALERHAVRVRGAVQGVGFRPFVHRLALELGLSGWVCNDGAGVDIEVQGATAALADFARRLCSEAPPLARVEDCVASLRPCVIENDGFRIAPSRAGPVRTASVPDAGTCDACLAELFSPADRRHRYAFVNCTHCGPRYTITRKLPYDRTRTSMAGFRQCARCLAEYGSPADRRYHAEPNACPACGPRLSLVDASGASIDGDAIASTLALLRAGRIVAIKGLGGFHLVCDARDADAVARLRERKHRDEKPFAVMASGAASAEQWVRCDAVERALLQSAERPVVLLPLRDDRPDPLVGIAPGLDLLGMMLPCTPIQYLLFHEAAGRPEGLGWLGEAHDLLLVMTSANPGGEPIAAGNAEAMSRLAGIADAVLLHDRAIVARCDDSVLRRGATGAPQFVRRARGYTPRPIKLPFSGPPVLATGAWLKNTVCITRDDEAFLSPHIGDLDNAATCDALVDTVAHLCAVLDVAPRIVAHDLHPDFFSTRFAAEYAGRHGLARVAVQHHHAHVAAVAAEHGVRGPLLGLALDGIGLGSDGGAWGGELLRVEGGRCERLGHVAPIAMPGGDRAAREPWRMAAAALHRLGRGATIAARFADQPAAAAVASMLAAEVRCPPTSSLGRWFDAAAALLRVRERSAYEGQAAMTLEAFARLGDGPSLADDVAGLVRVDDDGTLDPTPLMARLADTARADAPRAAALFHHALAEGMARWVARAAARTGLGTVALGGGCFLNAMLSGLLVDRLAALDLRVLEARQAPPNDGGIALGQAWVAVCRQAAGA
ncbi:MAG TPA: carbamoyltransferase HypF [Caldimonas sp.]|nr:carbamoyltransferase HypF [Caldimonas sp.]